MEARRRKVDGYGMHELTKVRSRDTAHFTGRPAAVAQLRLSAQQLGVALLLAPVVDECNDRRRRENHDEKETGDRHYVRSLRFEAFARRDDLDDGRLVTIYSIYVIFTIFFAWVLDLLHLEAGRARLAAGQIAARVSLNRQLRGARARRGGVVARWVRGASILARRPAAVLILYVCSAIFRNPIRVEQRGTTLIVYIYSLGIEVFCGLQIRVKAPVRHVARRRHSNSTVGPWIS
jgi:hypothetical protein